VSESREKFKVGDRVKLSAETRRRADLICKTINTAKIELFYKDIPGGVRLDRLLGGFYSWNMADLVHADGRSES
jgi:hypothetical protein